ncbi:MAG: hypothetical protein AAFP02_11225, partial [Bacteroidota bacterium]
MNRFWTLVLLSLLALPMGLHSQQSYPWTQIDSLLEQGLNRSALEKAEEVYQSAKTAKDQENQLKALNYILVQSRQLNEKGDS